MKILMFKHPNPKLYYEQFNMLFLPYEIQISVLTLFYSTLHISRVDLTQTTTTNPL